MAQHSQSAKSAAADAADGLAGIEQLGNLGTEAKPRTRSVREPARLVRSTIATSRLSEFSSQKELTAQTGHALDEWPLVVVKELIDNGLDAAETAGVLPVIEVVVTPGSISVADNGSGIASETVAKILDFSFRVSSNEAYASPTRGQQGNALQTILAMAFVLDGKVGTTTIESQGVKHRIVFEIDQIRRLPRVSHTTNTGFVKTGTIITVEWPECASTKLTQAKHRFLQIARAYVLLNPHLTLRLWCIGHREFEATSPFSHWAKWTAGQPTSAHWYDLNRLNRLIAATIASDEDCGRETLVREFVSTFRGMSATEKQKVLLTKINASRTSLAALFDEGRNSQGVTALLQALQHTTKPVKPDELGVIGRDTIERHFGRAGAELGSFKYVKQVGCTDGVPWIVEVAFAWLPSADERLLVTGYNFSAGISNPFPHLDYVLAEQHVDYYAPTILVVHLVCPVLAFTDRGKSKLALPDAIKAALDDAVIKVTATWAKQIKAEKRESAALTRRRDRLIASGRVSTKEAVFTALPSAWMAASAGGTLPASARQVYYALRNKVQEITGKQLDAQYVTQTLLPDYIASREVNWNVVFDDRGHFTEPHTQRQIGLGTLAVRDYVDHVCVPLVEDASLCEPQVATSGPHGNFGAVLFVEKEGFTPLFEHVRLAERFDLAVMSSKGMPSTSARRLIETLCGERGVPLFILHDFDKAGLSIAAVLGRDTRRYQFADAIRIVNLGLRLDDIEALSLEDSAEDSFDGGDEDTRRANLRLNGATDNEVEFLLERRVELNALTSDQLVRFVEDKLIANDVRKVIPSIAVLNETYAAVVRGERVRQVVEEALASTRSAVVPTPSHLETRVAEILRQHLFMRWDDAVALIAREAKG